MTNKTEINDYQKDTVTNYKEIVAQIGKNARKAAHLLSLAQSETKNLALELAANRIEKQKSIIQTANNLDIERGKEKKLSDAMIDRLALDDSRIASIANGLRSVASLPDPVGKIDSEWEQPNGLKIKRIRVPIGVIGVIYESRPNVTADAGALCLKAGNPVILRGGSESFLSSKALYACMRDGIEAADLPLGCIQMIPTRERAAVGAMLTMPEYIDVIVPRGGKSLIQKIQEDSKVPIFSHLEGICHVYIHDKADLEMAKNITLNAKMRRTGICGAAETLLIDNKLNNSKLIEIIDILINSGCEIRADEEISKIDPRCSLASEEDWSTEYLDSIISIRMVNGIDEAINHINYYGSNHTDSIVTSDIDTANRFITEVDSAIVLHNASTQFADGGEFGMGAEIGISTGRLHARGPVGVEQLTTYKYVVHGSGQVRP